MTKITAKGQVTIPKRLRDHLGLKLGHLSNLSWRQMDAFF